MNKPKHTPGPWFVSAGSKYVLAGGGTYRAVAEAFTCSDKWGMAPISEAERDANKRLIAAAPEMLELLKAIYKAASDGEKMSDGAGKHRMLKNIQFNAAQAIAKTEGLEPK